MRVKQQFRFCVIWQCKRKIKVFSMQRASNCSRKGFSRAVFAYNVRREGKSTLPLLVLAVPAFARNTSQRRLCLELPKLKTGGQETTNRCRGSVPTITCCVGSRHFRAPPIVGAASVTSDTPACVTGYATAATADTNSSLYITIIFFRLCSFYLLQAVRVLARAYNCSLRTAEEISLPIYITVNKLPSL